MAVTANDIYSIALDINMEGPQILDRLGFMLFEYNRDFIDSRFSAISKELSVYLTEKMSSIGDLIASLNQIPEGEIANFRQNKIFYCLAIAMTFEKKDTLLKGVNWETVKNKELRQALRKQSIDILQQRDLLREQQKKRVSTEKSSFADQGQSYPQASYSPQGYAPQSGPSYPQGQGYAAQSSSSYSQVQQGNGQPSYSPQGYAPQSGPSYSQVQQGYAQPSYSPQGYAPQSGPSYSQVQQGNGQPSYSRQGYTQQPSYMPQGNTSQGQGYTQQPSYMPQGNASQGQGYTQQPSYMPQGNASQGQGYTQQPSYMPQGYAAPPVTSFSQGQGYGQYTTQPSYSVYPPSSSGYTSSSISNSSQPAFIAAASPQYGQQHPNQSFFQGQGSASQSASLSSALQGYAPVAALSSYQSQSSSSVVPQPPAAPVTPPPVAAVPQPPVAPQLPVTPIPQLPVTPIPQLPVTPIPQPPVAPIPQPPVAPILQPPVVKEPVSISGHNPSAFFNAQPTVASPAVYALNPAPFLNQGSLLFQLKAYLKKLEEECRASPEDITKQHKRDVAQKLKNCLEINNYSVSVEFTEEEQAVCNDDSELKALVEKTVELFPALKDKLLPPSKGFGYH